MADSNKPITVVQKSPAAGMGSRINVVVIKPPKKNPRSQRRRR